MADVKERTCWDAYSEVYEDAIRHTATAHAPWYVVPADHKWFTRLVVGAAVIDALEELDLAYPTVDAHKRDELKLVRGELEQEGQTKKSKQEMKVKQDKALKKAKKPKSAKKSATVTADEAANQHTGTEPDAPV
jgi:hypothetical protein